MDSYAAQTGLDLRSLENAAVVGFDLGVLYLAETDADLTAATQVFSERLVTTPEVKRPHPHLTRISGVVGQTPESLLRYDGKLLAVAVGDTTTVRIVEAFALQKLKRAKRVFDGIALKTFRDFDAQAPLRFLAPGPFEDRWIYAGSGLLSVATAVGISAKPLARERLLVTIAIDGPWDEEGAQPFARMTQAWEALAQSSTGRLFGLHEPDTAPTISSSSQRVTLEVTLNVAPIVQGLHAAVSADVWEMLELRPTSTQVERSGECDGPAPRANCPSPSGAESPQESTSKPAAEAPAKPERN